MNNQKVIEVLERVLKRLQNEAVFMETTAADDCEGDVIDALTLLRQQPDKIKEAKSKWPQWKKDVPIGVKPSQQPPANKKAIELLEKNATYCGPNHITQTPDARMVIDKKAYDQALDLLRHQPPEAGIAIVLKNAREYTKYLIDKIREGKDELWDWKGLIVFLIYALNHIDRQAKQIANLEKALKDTPTHEDMDAAVFLANTLQAENRDLKAEVERLRKAVEPKLLFNSFLDEFKVIVSNEVPEGEIWFATHEQLAIALEYSAQQVEKAIRSGQKQKEGQSDE